MRFEMVLLVTVETPILRFRRELLGKNDGYWKTIDAGGVV
jgi:hypothetical protein